MSEQTRENLRKAVQFRAVQTPSGKRAYEAHVAIWNNAVGNEIMIGAASLNDLNSAWEKITGSPLDSALAQLVWIVQADKDAPRTKPEASNILCSAEGCTRLASFIINRRALCEVHRGK